MQMSHKFISKITIYLNLMLKIVECVFIDTNFYLYLNKICLSRQKNIILTEFSYDSLIKSYISKTKCDTLFEYTIFTNKSQILRINDKNSLIEFNGEEDLILILEKIFTDFLSTNINVIIVLKNNSFGDIEKRIFETYSGFRCYVLRYERSLNLTEIAYIRPLVDSCHLIDGVLYSSDANLKNMLTSNPMQCNLNGTLLRVVVNKVCLIINIYCAGKFWTHSLFRVIGFAVL
jgi:hypothetical protein